MAKKKPRNRYSKEFKSNAVKMSLKDGVQVKDVAYELGIPATYLSIVIQIIFLGFKPLQKRLPIS